MKVIHAHIEVHIPELDDRTKEYQPVSERELIQFMDWLRMVVGHFVDTELVTSDDGPSYNATVYEGMHEDESYIAELAKGGK